MTGFSPEVYAQIRAGAQRSAGIVAPMILAHTTPLDAGPRPYTPEVLDVGCGEGWWSAALQELGCRTTSIDQDAPAETARGVEVQVVDLEGDYVLPRNAFDLALCLEVAEHVTEAAGRRLVAELCASARAIAWSAAIPGQGGHGHVNERWPTFWAEVFRENGYVLVDPWRDALWDDPDVEPWYVQNLLLAQRATPGTLEHVPAPRCLIHPTIYLARLHEIPRLRGQLA